jgi:hypothetical protein
MRLRNPKQKSKQIAEVTFAKFFLPLHASIDICGIISRDTSLKLRHNYVLQLIRFFKVVFYALRNFVHFYFNIVHQ